MKTNMKEYDIRQYKQTLELGLIKVVKDLFPEVNLVISFSILDGVYCEFTDSLVSPREVAQIESCLREWVQAKSKITFLRKRDQHYQYEIDGMEILAMNPAFTDTSILGPFQLLSFPPGFILHFDGIDGVTSPFVLPEKLSDTYWSSRRWLERLQLSEINDVNDYILNGKSSDLVNIAEALQEKKISEIADKVLAERKSIKVILVSGPSSSGKTSFTQRLSTHLIVNGLNPVSLSLDDYFVNREDTPRDEDGQFDFDVLEALDLPLLNQHMAQLIQGETVEVPQFDFITGQRSRHKVPLQLGEGYVLLVEGIHAINPQLLPNLDQNYFFKIYVSALFLLSIDAYNRVSTTDVRLIRRMVRDVQYRGFEPERTLGQWPSVRRGENNSVFRYQEEADVMFNSSLLYELNALRSYAEPLLTKISSESPHHEDATRLLSLLSFFEPMATDRVPCNSILKEFIGECVTQ